MGTRGPDLQTRYESLRAQAITAQQGIHQPQGMALLIGSGVSAWMAAWAQIALHDAARPVESRTGDREVTPTSRTDEVVLVLAAMVHASCQGRT